MRRPRTHRVECFARWTRRAFRGKNIHTQNIILRSTYKDGNAPRNVHLLGAIQDLRGLGLRHRREKAEVVAEELGELALVEVGVVVAVVGLENL